MSHCTEDIFRDRALAADQIAALRRDNERLQGLVTQYEAALAEIERIAEARTIPDRHGKPIYSCDETCLNEILLLAQKARAP